jgi:hypothetical protein
MAIVHPFIGFAALHIIDESISIVTFFPPN